jgi:hypothetical protein
VWNLSDERVAAEIARHHYDVAVESARHLSSLARQKDKGEYHVLRRRLASSLSDVDRYAVLLADRWERER